MLTALSARPSPCNHQRRAWQVPALLVLALPDPQVLRQCGWCQAGAPAGQQLALCKHRDKRSELRSMWHLYPRVIPSMLCTSSCSHVPFFSKFNSICTTAYATTVATLHCMSRTSRRVACTLRTCWNWNNAHRQLRLLWYRCVSRRMSCRRHSGRSRAEPQQRRPSHRQQEALRPKQEPKYGPAQTSTAPCRIHALHMPFVHAAACAIKRRTLLAATLMVS